MSDEPGILREYVQQIVRSAAKQRADCRCEKYTGPKNDTRLRVCPDMACAGRQLRQRLIQEEPQCRQSA